MMTYKQYRPDSFQFLDSIGMRVSKISEVKQKMHIGLRMGLSNLVTVLFGLYSVKLVSIPLYVQISFHKIYRFLTFRRCSILTTVLMAYIINKVVPERKLCISLVLTGLGAFFAGVNDNVIHDLFLFLVRNF